MKKSFNKSFEKSTNVEFGMEFGDLNASKLYEVPFMNKQISEKRKKKRITNKNSPFHLKDLKGLFVSIYFDHLKSSLFYRSESWFFI